MGMIATFPIKNAAGARMRMAPTEKAAFPYAKGSILPKCPSSEVVCLVDDDPLVLRSTGLLLASEGFVVRQFDKGKDFIAYVASHDVPLVVLDIWMEEMNGLEVLARLSAMSPQTHVIVITGREDIVARVTATRLGAGAFLIKPFDAEQFLEAVHDALGPPAHFEQSVVAPAEASSTARFSRKCSVSERAMLAA
jgi:FixJ family two-component response regulator